MENALPPTLHKLATVMSRTGLSRSELYRQIRLGRLKVTKVGRAVRVRESDLNAFIDSVAVA